MSTRPTLAINGKMYTEDEVLDALQKHFKTGDLYGNRIQMFKKCLDWQARGVAVGLKRHEHDYENFLKTDDLPDYVLNYYAEVVDSNRPKASTEAVE